MGDRAPGGPPTASPLPRALAWGILALFLSPLLALGGLQLRDAVQGQRAEAEAERELASAHPPRAAYGVLGAIRVKQGRLGEALALLRTASDLEFAAGGASRDTLERAEALSEALRRGVAGVTRADLEAALDRAEAEAADARLPKPLAAATWFSCGTYWRDLDAVERERQDFARAVALQPDDWQDWGGGRRTKAPGLASYYQQMLAGATQRAASDHD